MADIDWLPPAKLREHYVEPVAVDAQDAQRVLYLAVITGLMSRFGAMTITGTAISSLSSARRRQPGPGQRSIRESPNQPERASFQTERTQNRAIVDRLLVPIRRDSRARPRRDPASRYG